MFHYAILDRCCCSVFHWDHVFVMGLSVTGVSHEWFLMFVWYYCWCMVLLVLCITSLWVVLIVYLHHDIVCTTRWCYKRWSGGSQQRSSQCALPPAMPTAHRPGWPRHERCRTVQQRVPAEAGHLHRTWSSQRIGCIQHVGVATAARWSVSWVH